VSLSKRYEVIKVLGSGSTGTVYLCRHKEIASQFVAVKVLFPELSKSKEGLALIHNDIVASYSVSHPNVVRAYEYFQDEDFVGYSMEYVDGGDLAQALAEDRFSDLRAAAETLAEICAGLSAIHSAGLIHRNLKPENILLTKEGKAKIADFGHSRKSDGPKLMEQNISASIDYVPPEYLEHTAVDLLTDIYGVGVVAFEMITGEMPFKGATVIETMNLRLKGSPNAPNTIRENCPKSLSDFVTTAMARERDKRYQTAGEMLAVLQSILKTDLSH